MAGRPRRRWARGATQGSRAGPRRPRETGRPLAALAVLAVAVLAVVLAVHVHALEHEAGLVRVEERRHDQDQGLVALVGHRVQGALVGEGVAGLERGGLARGHRLDLALGALDRALALHEGRAEDALLDLDDDRAGM